MGLFTIILLLALLPIFARSQAPTDEYRDADVPQSGYLDNHNIHPAIVGSSDFGILWKNNYDPTNQELWYARPLVFTPAGASQLLFTASNKNTLRTLDAVNGTLLNSRTVQPPFLASVLNCGDIPNYIGIIGTPVIDPSSNTAYFFSKGYIGAASTGGVLDGRYLFYAVDVQTLEDKLGFPVLIDGHYADNDNTRYFLGGTILQRPSLVQINGVVVGAFGGHCDLFNYTGMLVAVSTTPGVGVTSIFAMESSPGAPAPQALDYTSEQGGRAGIWQSGMGISVDEATSRIFFATGNGEGHANGDVPASGRTPLSTLDEVVASFTVSDTGKFSLNDYFEPAEYIDMDAGDRDLGSSGVTLLNSSTFSAGVIAQIAVVVGKNAKVYILDANDLGGLRKGSLGIDKVIQTISLNNTVFGGVGSYPLEGGFIYWTPIGFPTVAYQMGLDQSGSPQFTEAGSSLVNGAGRVGIGIPTITSYKGQPGTGIVWVTDPQNGLQAFNAVPVNSQLVQIPLSATGGLNKFIRPTFGDALVYVTDFNSNIICLGAPVALPLQCSTPVDFGNVNIGSTATQNVTCTALIAITSIDGCNTGDDRWQCENSTLPVGPLAQGATFTFPVTWNLTQYNLSDAPNSSTGKIQPGFTSTNLDIFTENLVSQYSTLCPISLTGTEVAQGPYFSIKPIEVDFGGIVVGTQSVVSGFMVIANTGSQQLIILGTSWTPNIDATKGSVTYTNITHGNLGAGFASTSFPPTGTVLDVGQPLTIPLSFTASQVGHYSTFVKFWTNGVEGGAEGDVLLVASAALPPIANISVSLPGGGSDYAEPLVVEFGNITTGTEQSRNIQICNNGGSALTITKSKAPDQMELYAPNVAIDLYKGQVIAVGQCAVGIVTIAGQDNGVNHPAHGVSGIWTLNTDDLSFGVHDVLITASIVDRQVGPLLSDGDAEYLYLGCYFDGSGRQLSFEKDITLNENGICQTTCSSGGYIFAGTEYHIQCWCGNVAPSYLKYTDPSENKCEMNCPGDTSQSCGGDGAYISIYYDRRKYSPGNDSIPGFVSSSLSTSTAPTSSSSTSSISLSSATSLSISSKSHNKYVGFFNFSSSISSLKASSLALSSISTVPASTSSSNFASTSRLSNFSTSTSSSSSFSKSISAVTPTISSGPSSVATIGAYSYVGCFTEGNGIRALTGKTLAANNMTVAMCYNACVGFTWFGLEYHRECYCGYNLNGGSAPATSGTTCSMACMGNSSELCGGSDRLSMYNNLGSGAGFSIMPPKPAATVRGFASVGCFSDSGLYAGHNMPRLFVNNSMTPDLCISSAQARLSATPATTFLYAGVEYGRECYAGTAAPSPEPTSLVGVRACSMSCLGDGAEACGGPMQYNLYAVPTLVSSIGTGKSVWSAPPTTSSP